MGRLNNEVGQVAVPVSSPIVPGVVRSLRSSEWLPALAAIDLCKPAAGMAAERWAQLVEDARWIASAHGTVAAALGWRASDLFGIDPAHDGWGGLVDRLAGARVLKLTANVAHWRNQDGDGWLWRESLTPKPLLWDTWARAAEGR